MQQPCPAGHRGPGGTHGGGVYISRVMDGGGKLIWVLWSIDGLTHTINLSKLPDSVYDALGSPLVPGNTLDVDLIPVYLEWNN